MNKLIRNIALLVLVLASVVVLLREVLDMGIVVKIAKSLLMPSLCVLGLQYIKNTQVRVRYIFAMFFYMMGDILLLYGSRVVFECGMGAFFIGHLFCLGMVYRLLCPISVWKLLVAQVISIGLACVITFGIMKVSGIVSYLVVAYTAILVYLVCIAVLLGSKILSISAILFFISDSLIAMNAFCNITFPGRSTIVMFCYILSQLFFTQGIARRTLARRGDLF